ncbi:MAG: DEAD/DEAH box helicase family protein [Nitrososphaera sp.]
MSKLLVLKATLTYDKGTIVIRGLAHIPYAILDPRTNVLRALALYYSNIVEYLKQSSIEYSDHVLSEDTKMLSLSLSSSSPISLRDYQQRAVDNWLRAGLRGCVVLPTGAGKTIVGIRAIEKANSSSLVVVPTLDLMDQWTATLSKYFPNIRIGNLGGGNDDIQSVTVCTYDSAYIRAAFLGNKFSLVIFDEVHHLAALGYRTIAEQMAAPFRLGLTATIKREDDLHKDLPRLVGEVVFQANPDELARDKHLAPYEIERRTVEMLPDELEEYQRNMNIYQQCIKKLNFQRYPFSLEKLIIMSGRNRTAREALLARNKAMNVALNSRAKIEELREILAENKGSKAIIFTQHNSLVYEISDKFLIPLITHKTIKEERQDVLKGFKEGRYMAIVTSKVLDEGVDIPDAELGIILSGTGSAREFIQRLGRLLRPKPNTSSRRVSNSSTAIASNYKEYKKARMIEIISSETKETITSARRKKALKIMRSNNNYDYAK